MAESAGLAWYDTGTVTLAEGSAAVSGANTGWSSAGIKAGDILTVDDTKMYQIASVNSNTSLTLKKAYTEAGGTGLRYSIIRNFAATVTSQLAARVAELVNKYEKYIDADLTKITGPAADFSEQYRGTWSSGRTYKALDVVLYNKEFYMTHSAHTSGSGNSPSSSGSLWVSVSAEVPVEIINEIKSGLSDTTAKVRAPYIFLGYLNKAEGNETREGMLIRRAHEKNMHLRQKSLGEFTDAYRNMIADGSYLFTDDIQLGDYWTAESTFTPPEGVTWTGDKNKGTTWVENEDGTVTIKRHWQVVDFALPYSGGSMNVDIDHPGGNGNRHISLAVMPVEPLFADKMTPYDDKPEAGWTSGGYYSSRYFSKTWETAREIAEGVFPSMLCNTMSYWQTYGNFTEGKGFTRYVGNSRYDATANHGDGRHVIVRNYTEAQAKKLHTQSGNWLGALPSTYDEMLPTHWNIFSCRYSSTVSTPPLLGAQYHHLAYFRMGGLRNRWATVHYQDELGQNQGGFGSCWLQDAVSADEYLALVGNNPQFCTPVSADAQLGIRPIFTIHLVV